MNVRYIRVCTHDGNILVLLFEQDVHELHKYIYEQYFYPNLYLLFDEDSFHMFFV